MNKKYPSRTKISLNAEVPEELQLIGKTIAEQNIKKKALLKLPLKNPR